MSRSVDTASTNKATYTYDATGQKVRNTGTDGTWDYIGSIVYHNGAIEFIQTEEARAKPNGGAYAYQYDLKDHLGNTRASFYSNNGAASILQEDEYYAFGLRQGVYDAANNNRYLYNGKEVQTDLADQYDYGARFYDPVIARWTIIDRFTEKYRDQAPYQYVLNNPVKSIDVNGDTTVVLHAPRGAHGTGHMAALIQGSDGKYHLYSKNGTNQSAGMSGPNDKGNDVGTGAYKSPEEFMRSGANPIINQKTGEREYTEGYVIPTTKGQDKKAINAAKKELAKDYNVLGSNCACTVQKALSAADKEDGSPTFFESFKAVATGNAIGGPLIGPILGKASSTANKKTPNIIYKRIKEQNEGNVVKP